MNIYAISDIHGQLPPLPPANANVLLMAGDICPDGGDLEQSVWLGSVFKSWCEDIELPIIATWGNHDFVGEDSYFVPKIHNATWLVDESVWISDLWVYGRPWVPSLPYWAFSLSPAALEANAAMIPAGADILMSHGPPHRLRDCIPTGTRFNSSGSPRYVGDKPLREKLAEKAPKAVVCGHIHEGHGVAVFEKSTIYNVAAVDEYYVMRPDPWVQIHI